MRRAIARRLWPLVALAFALAPAFFWSGEMFSEEMAGLLRKNWAPRTFLQKTFDPRGGEDFYQGRELSYAIDCLDADWVRWLMEKDRLLLVPPSGFLASLAFVPIGLWLLPRALPGLGGATRWLALLVFLSNFVVQCSMGVLFRATKPIVAPLLLALLLLVLAEFRRPRLAPSAAAASVAALGLAIGLLDRQGLFYLLCVALGLAVAWVLTKRGLPLLIGAAAASGAWLVYFNLIGARLIHALNGYWPRLGFQRLRPAALLARGPWLGAVELLGDWTSVLLGSLPAALVLLVVICAGVVWAWQQRRDSRRVAFVIACALAVAAAQLTMVAMMVERHSPVTWPGSRLWYYPLPYQAVATFGLLLALEALTKGRSGLGARAVPLVLAGLVVLNVLVWPEKLAIMNADPPFAEQATNSAVFVRSIRTGRADLELVGSNRLFFFDCLARFPRLGTRARPQVGEGEGFYRSELQDGHLVAWAQSDAQLIAWARPGGRYLLAGRAWLRHGETLTVLLKSRQPRLLGEIRSAAGEDHAQPFRIEAELGQGANVIELVSSLPGRPVPDLPRDAPAAYRLALPVLLLPMADESPGAVRRDAADPSR